MELEHSFTVPVPLERAWEVLLDVERVAPCMPGATLDSVEGDDIAGRIKVKVGPITMTYTGTAKFTEKDVAARAMTLEASGKETRGAGTASATVRSELTAADDQTHVRVRTTLNVTGKPAQFGRGVMAEVGGKLIGIFADNLAAMLVAEPAASQAATPDASLESNEVRPDSGAADEALPIDVLNLGSRAWSSLRRDGIQTLGDLTRRSSAQLLAIENIGPASVAEIKSKLADRGLSLAGTSGSHRPSGSNAKAAAESGSASLRPVHEANGDRPGKHAADDVAPVTPLRPPSTAPADSAAGQHSQVASTADREPAAWQPQDDAVDLLGVAGLPVLKRALPAAAGLIAVIVVLFGLRRRRARRN